MTQRILVTGGAGRIGRYLRERMAAPDRVLRLLDSAEQEPARSSSSGTDEADEADEAVEIVRCSVTDAEAMTAACADVDALVHLAGVSTEGPWDQILDASINGTKVTLDAAVAAGIPTVVLASSNHAVGFTPRPAEGMLPDSLPPRPDTLYGVSKVAIEGLGQLYADRFGLRVVALRIGSCRDEPTSTRELGSWLSPDDMARLAEAAITWQGNGFRAVWGVSANTRRWWSLEGGADLGYHPQDDAEFYSAGIEPSDPAGVDGVQRVGGPYTTTSLGERPAN